MTMLIEPEGKFDLIYADPPWQHSHRKVAGSAEDHYDLMTLEDIMALPVESWCNKDAVLFLWACAPLIPEGIDVLRAWGFKFVTSAFWNKMQTGIGHWFLGQVELCYVGTRGHFSPPPPSKRRSSLFDSPRFRHSQKPEEVRLWVDWAFPEARKLELFARKPEEGWTVWGNEADGLSFREYVAGQQTLFQDKMDV